MDHFLNDYDVEIDLGGTVQGSSIRDLQPVGYVVSEREISIKKVYVLITDQQALTVLGVGRFLVAQFNGVKTLLRITDLKLRDPYSDANAVDTEIKLGLLFSDIVERLPGHVALAETEPLLSYARDYLRDPIPPKPRAPVYLLDEATFYKFYYGSIPRGIEIGTVLGAEGVRFILPFEALERHVLIAGGTGTGKSWLLGVLTEQLARYNVYHVNIDIMNEFDETFRLLGGANLVAFQHFVPDLRVVGQHAIKLFDSVLTSELQKAIASMAIEDFIRGGPQPASRLLDYVNNAARRMNAREDTRQNMLTRLRTLLRDIYGSALNSPPTTVEEFARLLNRQRRINIIVSREHPAILDLVVVSVIEMLKQARTRGLIEDRAVILSIDEAHRIVPKSEWTAARAAIVDILRRGRHYGISTILITQLPSALDDEAISLPNAVFVFALPRQQLSVLKSYLADAEMYLDMLGTFPTGHCLVGGSKNFARFTVPIKVTDRRITPHRAYTRRVV